MSIVLSINAVDKTDQVDWKTLQKEEVLTKEPDSLIFRIKNYGTKTYRPELGDEVTLEDGADLIFGGVVIDTSEEIEGLAKFFVVRCKDFTQTLDRELVVEVYENMSAEDIINDIITSYAPTFTTTNVNAPTIVEKIVFNYLPISAALQKLSETLGNHDWYVDYAKDIHFFQEGANSAPFNLDDTTGNFLFRTLRLTSNIHQLRNHIIIRGGDHLGDSFTDKKTTDGVQRLIFVGYNLTSFTADKAYAATPTTFFSLTVGRDGVDSEFDFDALYNPNNGLLKFPDATKPAVDDVIRFSGTPIFPLIAEKLDVVSIAQFGTYQYLIVDKSIRSREAASQRANAELLKWSAAISEASFETNRSGLRTGQTININSTIRGINKDFRITRISTRMSDPNSFTYNVSLLASEEVTMVDVLNKLLVKDPSNQIDIGENELLDKLYSAIEDITVSESFTSSQSHNATPETITATEVDIEQPLNYATEFVLAPYIPTIAYNGSDHKRVFLLNGSYLA